ncbi:hypothetical protein D3C85_850740 [compost metagenome]
MIHLGSGDERIAAGAGNDTLLGGEGQDTALYQGNQHDFAIGIQGGDQISVYDLNFVDGNEGIDTLHNFEMLQFGDGVRLQALVGEGRVNRTTASNQINPSVAALADGGYVVSWSSPDLGGNGYGIYAQRYDASGAAVGDEVRVNSTIGNDQVDPSVAALADGGYVVSWMSSSQDGSGWGIYAQRYDASGVAVGDEVRVNSTTGDDQDTPTVAGLSDGGYVVSWMSYGQDGSGWGIYSQRFDANGNPVVDHLEWTGDASANLIRSTLETDWFNGGAGADTFQFAQLPGARADLITDFTQGSDVLALNTGVFDLQGQSVAQALANVSGVQNEAPGAQLVFNQDDHTLYYDVDGAANGNAVAVVTLIGVANLAASDVGLYV